MATIQVYECLTCGKKNVQLKRICPTCQSIDFQITEICGKGKVYSYTTIHVSSQEFSHLTPYTVALIELEQGLRVTGRVKSPVAIGDPVTCIKNKEPFYLFEKENRSIV